MIKLLDSKTAAPVNKSNFLTGVRMSKDLEANTERVKGEGVQSVNGEETTVAKTVRSTSSLSQTRYKASAVRYGTSPSVPEPASQKHPYDLALVSSSAPTYRKGPTIRYPGMSVLQ
jgi:hypothetical protein